MTFSRSALMLLLPAALAAQVLVLEDFETPDAAGRWDGPVAASADQASHGRYSAIVRLDRDHSQVSSARLPGNWSGYERLLFDIYTERNGVATATLRVYDAVGGDAGAAGRDEYFDGRNKIFLQKGWTHVEVRLTPLKAATFLRDISLDRVRRLLLSFDPNQLPATIYIDNFRLVSGVEGPETSSRLQPQDAVSTIDNRWVTVRQVARPEDVPEAPEVTKLRREAERESELLRAGRPAGQ